MTSRELQFCPDCRAVYREDMPRCPRDGTPLEPMLDDPLVGTVLANKYSIVELVGEGAMGRVYRAEHVELGRAFAVKVMFGDLAARDQMRKRFAREAQIASRLSHRNVVPILDYGVEQDSVMFHVMEFLSGTSLGDVLQRGPIGPARTRSIALQVARGLRHAHDLGLVHRDLKPENVMLVHEDDEEVAKIVDFGIAVNIEETEARLTHTGHIVGTPTFMAPEQGFGSAVDARSDLYALGAVLYTCLVGKTPFTGDPITILQRKMSEDPPDVRDFALHVVPEPLASLVMGLLAREREDRPKDADEVLARLEAPTNDGLEVAITPPPERRAAVLASILLGMAAIGLVGYFWAGRSRPAPTPPPGRLVDAPPLPATSEAPTEPPRAPEETPAPEPEAEPSAPTPAPTRARPRAPKRPARAVARREAPTKTPTAVAPKAPPPRPASASDGTDADPGLALFTATYVRVGEQLQAAKNDDDVTALRKRYFAIPYADALRVQSVRRDAQTELRAIARALDRGL